MDLSVRYWGNSTGKASKQALTPSSIAMAGASPENATKASPATDGASQKGMAKMSSAFGGLFGKNSVGKGTITKTETITEHLSKAIGITLTIPQEVRKDKKPQLIRTHEEANGVMTADPLDDEDDDADTYTFNSDRFCTMAFVYTESSGGSSASRGASSGSSGVSNGSASPSNSSSSSGGGKSGGAKSYKGGKNASRAYFAKTGKKTVSYLAPSIRNKAKKAVVPEKVKLGKKTYKVTSVAPYAFTGYDNLETVVIGRNVRRLAKNCFFGCKKLDTVIVRTGHLTEKKTKGALHESGVKVVVLQKDAKGRRGLYRKIFKGCKVVE